MSGMASSPQGQHMSSSRDYTPQIKLEQPPSQHQQPPGASSVPNVLQPGGLSARPQATSVNTAPMALPTIHGSMSSTTQHQSSPHDYLTSSKPSHAMPSHSHSYSRSSPTAGYDVPPSSYQAYTPTTPTGSSSQFVSPGDAPKYGAPGSQRNFSNAPLGLADIRSRADSSISDSAVGTAAHDLANAQPGPSNYLAPWAVYALDWCKWLPQGSGAGKLAVGSYLEDGHNFVRNLHARERTASCLLVLQRFLVAVSYLVDLPILIFTDTNPQ